MSAIDKTGFVDIPGYEGLYAINRHGNIWSYYSSKVIRQWIAVGYAYVGLSKDAKTTNLRVSRLVAITFILNPENKPEVNHKDGNKLNNYADNLEWVTGSENKKHAYEMGLRKSDKAVEAMKFSRRKLSLDEAKEIKSLYATGNYYYRQLGEMYGVSLHAIYRIVKSKAYREVA